MENVVAQPVKILSIFMQSRGSLQCSQDPAKGPYPW